MEISDRQNIKKLDKKKVQKYLKEIFFYLSIGTKKASFVFCDNFFISKLNIKYFGKNTSTDVISFPLADKTEPGYLGEVIVSVEEAVLTAKKLDLDWQGEMLLYLIHGVMHLIGFKDQNAGQRKITRQKEKEILAKFEKIKLSL